MSFRDTKPQLFPMSQLRILFAVVVLFLFAPAFAQDDTPAVPPEAPPEPAPAAPAEPEEIAPVSPAVVPDPLPPVPAVRPTLRPDSSGDAEAEIVRSERSVYVPYEDLEKLFENEGRGVFLPYKEFLDLWNQLAVEKEKEKEKPPTDGVVSSAMYTATVEGTDNQVLAIDAVLRAESFKEDGWAVVPLIKAGLNIAEADTGEATLHLGKNGYELILPQKGQYEIRLKLYAKIEQSAGRNQVGINLPKAGVSKFEAVLPETGWEFEIKPAAAYSSQPVGEGNTGLSFFFGETEHFDVVWQKQGEESSLQPLLFVETDQFARLVPGALQTDVNLRYRILRAGVNTFSVTVPVEQEILNVAGENIKQWDITEADEGQKLVVELHSAVKDNYTLTLTLEEAVDTLPAELPLPQIEADNVVRQRGSVTVNASQYLEVETISRDGLTQQAIADGANDPKAGKEFRPLGRFRYLDLPYDFVVSVAKAEPLVDVESWTRFKVDLDTSEFTTRFDYEIKRVGIFDTRIAIPDGFEGVEATGEIVDDYSEETDGDGNRFLTVTFKNRSEGKITFNVTGRLVREDTEVDATVPVFTPQSVERHEGKVGLEIHTSLDPRTAAEGDLRQQDVSLVASNLPGEGPLQIGFRYRGEAEPATISFTAKQPQVSGEVFALIEVREQIVRYEWTVAYDILYAGVDTLVLSIPEDIANDLRHDGTLIKEVDKDYTPPEGEDAPVAADGQVLWAVILREKKMGSYQLKLNLNRPIASLVAGEEAEDGQEEEDETVDPDNATTFPVALPEISLKEVHTETGQIAVVKDDNLEILDSETTALEPIDPQELRGGLARPGVFLSYKFRRHPLALHLDVSRNEFLPVPQAIVTYASLTSVVSGDKAVTSEVIYWVKNNAKQFFSVSLPEGGSMVSDIYVNGQPQQPMSRAGEDVVLIRLPVGDGNAETEFPVRFIFETPSPDPGDNLGWTGSIDVPVAELLDAEILQSRLHLYVPDDYVYHRFDSAMHLPLGERGWTRFRNAFDWLVPTLGPQIPVRRESQWQEPPSLPAAAGGGFDLEIPTEGQRHTLHRLDRPDTVKVGYRSKGFALFWEAVLALAAFIGGLFLIARPIRHKLIFFAAAGLLPLVIAGAVTPTAASFWTAIYLGTFLAALIWILRGVPALLKRLGQKTKQLISRRKSKKKKKPKPKPVTGEPADDESNPVE